MEVLTDFLAASMLLQLLPFGLNPLSLPEESAQPAGDIVPVKKDSRRLGIDTTAVSAIVVDRQSGAVLFEKNREIPRAIGSITKLMTAYVFLEGNPDLEAEAQVDSEDVRLGGVQHLKVGEPVRVRDLLYASLVSSDNSATAALVRLSGMAYGDFVVRMNETAASFGMTKTRFADTTGLSSKNTSVVMDLVRLLDQTSRHEVIRDATTRAAFDVVTREGTSLHLQNTNDLLSSFMNRDPYRIVAAKTGFLPEAGYCLAAMFSRSGTNEFIVVVLGSESDAGRFQDVKALGAWAYDAYEWGSRKVGE